MTTQSAQRRRFTVDEYYTLAEAGILAPDERVELLDGVIHTKYTATPRRFTVSEYYAKAQAGITLALWPRRHLGRVPESILNCVIQESVVPIQPLNSG